MTNIKKTLKNAGIWCGVGVRGEYWILGENEAGKKVHNELFPDDYNSGISPLEWNYLKIIDAEESWLDVSKYQSEKQKEYMLTQKLMRNNIAYDITVQDIGFEKEIDIVFGIPQRADSNDIIINEILFDPISPGVDYLELYNRSEKVIDLSKILIGTIKESFPNPADTIVKEICSESRILLPKSYVLLSTDEEIVKHQYDCESDNFIDLESFPSLPNEEATIIICDKSKKIIDVAYYSEKMHYDLLSETKGVALERITFNNSSLDKNNWHSASSNVNYGTPGYKNSMSMNEIEEIKNEEIYIIPEIFSPDGDGYNDNCAINYKLEENGFSININIFNSKGHLIRKLLRNCLVNSEGFTIWDGCDDNNHRVEPGIYIVQIELFDLEGNVERKRKVVVVATK